MLRSATAEPLAPALMYFHSVYSSEGPCVRVHGKAFAATVFYWHARRSPLEKLTLKDSNGMKAIRRWKNKYTNTR